MAVTRSNLESILLNRCGRKMTSAGLDGSTSANNPDLNDPLSSALLDMGFMPADLTSIKDEDVAQAGARIPELLDRAELRLLKNIAGNLDLVDISVGPRKESFSQLHEQILKQIDTLTADVMDKYGSGSTSSQSGFFELDFQERF